MKTICEKKWDETGTYVFETGSFGIFIL